jgi:hypothetical protein
MKAFYIIHITVILETILAIFMAVKLHEFTLKIKKMGIEIKKNSELKLAKITEFHTRIRDFNIKSTQKFTRTFDFIKNILGNILMQGIIKKYMPKNNFISKLLPYKATIFWFLVTFFFFRKKNA